MVVVVVGGSGCKRSSTQVPQAALYGLGKVVSRYGNEAEPLIQGPLTFISASTIFVKHTHISLFTFLLHPCIPPNR